MNGNDARGTVSCLIGHMDEHCATRSWYFSHCCKMANDEQDNQQTQRQLQNICTEKSICVLDQLFIQPSGDGVYEHLPAHMMETHNDKCRVLIKMCRGKQISLDLEQELSAQAKFP